MAWNFCWQTVENETWTSLSIFWGATESSKFITCCFGLIVSYLPKWSLAISHQVRPFHGVSIPYSESEPESKFNVSRIFPSIPSPFWSKTALFTRKSPFLSENIWNQNRNAKTLGSRLGIVSESESSSRHVWSQNRNRNRILDLDSLRTGIGTGFQD